MFSVLKKLESEVLDIFAFSNINRMEISDQLAFFTVVNNIIVSRE